MRHITIIIFFQLLFLSGFSQDLILNGDFEDINLCTEQLEFCSPEAWKLTSSSFVYFHRSKENNLVEFIIHSVNAENKRSYIQSRLGDTLIVGAAYRISFDISPNRLAINRLGINFSDTIVQTLSDTLINITPDIEIIDNKTFLRDKRHRHWRHIEQEFVATEKAIYIQIGSFDTDDNRKYKKVRVISPKDSWKSQYFIDNISLVSTDSLHLQSEIDCIKRIIYSQNYRHPADNSLFTIEADKICLDKKEILQSKQDTIVLFGDFLFELDSYEPSEQLYQKVDSVFSEITSTIDSITVIGYTDNTGSKGYNYDLSFKRAESVSGYISSLKVINDNKIIFFGRGANYPVASNKTEIGRQRNRRVEIIFKY